MNTDERRLGFWGRRWRGLAVFLCASVLIGGLAPVVRADWTLTTADFKTQAKLSVNTWMPGEGLSVSTAAGNLVKTASRDVVSLVSERAKAAGSGKWTLTLRNGDVLDGEPVGVTGQALSFAVAELGTIELPIKSLAILQFKESKLAASATGAAADKDVVKLRNGDQMEGIFLSLDADKLKLASGADSTPAELELGHVDRVSFGGVTAARAVGPLAARVTFVSGSVLTVPLSDKDGAFSWSVGDVVVRDPAGKPRKTTADQIVSLEVLGGRVIFLTELDPAKDKQVSYLDTQWPTQVNRNVLGQPLKAGKVIYARGLGVHTRSVLTYDLAAAGGGGEGGAAGSGGFETLMLRAGVDDSAAPYGEASLSVVLDGKVLWEGRNMKAGQVSEELRLPVKDGKMLELRAEPAGRLDVLGRVDWLNAALVRR
jgi:hypothetical protein